MQRKVKSIFYTQNARKEQRAAPSRWRAAGGPRLRPRMRWEQQLLLLLLLLQQHVLLHEQLLNARAASSTAS